MIPPGAPGAAEPGARRGSPLDGQIAVVTGGASGIGRAASESLARLGCRLVVVDLGAGRAEEAAAALAASTGATGAFGLGLDVTSEADMERMASVTLERCGRIDILVACAGILRARGATPKPLADMPPREWDEVIAVNLRGTFLSNRAVLAGMIRQRSGQILNVSSTSGRKGRALDGAYCASKFGVIGLTESLAEEVRHYNIRVQVILPDVVATPLWEQNGAFGAPPDALPAARVGDLIAYMLSLPADAVLQGLVVSPFRGRRRRPGGPAAGPPGAAGAGTPRDPSGS